MQGRFTIPTRIYLEPSERERLLALLRREGRTLDDLVTALVQAHLAHVPEPAEPSSEHQERAVGETMVGELHQRRTELRRLRFKLHDPHNEPPHWLRTMVSELEAEIARLEVLQDRWT
ncbi:MAG: hypothetical protein EOM24_31440 [Chloroflexia bacterium]|nr:hypothetical protein [Chloroflexia bacterium]